MELAIRVQVEELPEGLFLATSDELDGLVAQGRTVAETLEIARDSHESYSKPAVSEATSRSYPPVPSAAATQSLLQLSRRWAGSLVSVIMTSRES